MAQLRALYKHLPANRLELLLFLYASDMLHKGIRVVWNG